MSSLNESRLSLVVQFDDIVRNTSVLTTGIESEFYRFVQSQEQFRKRWQDAFHDTKDLKRKIKQLESENSALETKLKHAR